MEHDEDGRWVLPIPTNELSRKFLNSAQRKELEDAFCSPLGQDSDEDEEGDATLGQSTLEDVLSGEFSAADDQRDAPPLPDFKSYVGDAEMSEVRRQYMEAIMYDVLMHKADLMSEVSDGCNATPQLLTTLFVGTQQDVFRVRQVLCACDGVSYASVSVCGPLHHVSLKRLGCRSVAAVIITTPGRCSFARARSRRQRFGPAQSDKFVFLTQAK